MYHLRNEHYAIDEFQHEFDRLVMEKIINSSLMTTINKFLKDNNIETVYNYIYQSSCINVTREMASTIWNIIDFSCEMFDLQDKPKVYLTRDYTIGIEVGGGSSPFILISTDYLESIYDEDLLAGCIAANIAAIKAGHAEVAFLLWAIDQVAGAVSGKAKQIFVSSLNEWSHMRNYTVDKAFYLATGNYELALKQIFIQKLSYSQLYNFNFGNDQDQYLIQSEDFVNSNGINSVIHTVNAFLEEDAWIPVRYNEIKKMHQERWIE